MSFSSLSNKHEYSGNDLTTQWPYTFPITTADGSEIEVWLTSPAGVTTETTNFTVDVAGSEVVYPTVVIPATDPLPTDWKITLLRVQPLTQLLDLITQGSFNAEVIESAFDKVTMICQQLQEESDRSLKVGLTEDTATSDVLIAQINTAVTAAEAAQVSAASAKTGAEAAQTAAEAAQTAAEAAADKVPTIVAGDAYKFLQVKSDESGNEYNALDTDGTLSANSDTKISSQKAVKTYADTKAPKASPVFTGEATIPTVDLTGGQIAFPASQSASADANTLDDYEEGTFTMTLTFGGASVGLTYAAQTGYYTKIGNIVTCTGRLQLSNKGSSVGGALVSGLPFVVVNNVAGKSAVSIKAGNVIFANMPNSGVDLNAATFGPAELSDGGVNSGLNDANFANNSLLDILTTYRVA